VLIAYLQRLFISESDLFRKAWFVINARGTSRTVALWVASTQAIQIIAQSHSDDNIGANTNG
jgi:hypothetical protein